MLKAEGRFAALRVAANRTVKLGDTVATVGLPVDLAAQKDTRARGLTLFRFFLFCDDFLRFLQVDFCLVPVFLQKVEQVRAVQ